MCFKIVWRAKAGTLLELLELFLAGKRKHGVSNDEEAPQIIAFWEVIHLRPVAHRETLINGCGGSKQRDDTESHHRESSCAILNGF